jgi:hypothetical protein
MGAGAAGAEKALVAILAAIRAGGEKIVKDEFFGAAPSGPESIWATAAGAICGFLDGKHGTLSSLSGLEQKIIHHA